VLVGRDCGNRRDTDHSPEVIHRMTRSAASPGIADCKSLDQGNAIGMCNW
jgi:hypothetical protein